MTRISIEAAGTEHLAAIPAIEIAAAAMFPDADLPLEMRYLVTDGELLREAQADGRLWVALNGAGQPVGFALADTVDGRAHLDEVDVHPDYGRQGVGTRLLREFIDWASAADFPYATLITFRHLPWNAPFYEKLGFESMPAAEIGAELAALLEDEGRVGLDVSKRICMRFDLSGAGN